MGFLNSWQMWTALGAAGISVPIIIHLLHRKHRRQTDWAAMELLRRALVIRSGQVKLEDFLILFLRCLAIALLAIAMLRPTFNTNTTRWLGEERVGMVVAIDASYSMNHGEYSRFEKAVDRAKQILETADEGEPVSLVLMSNHPQVLLRRTGYDPAVFEDLLEEQESAKPYRLSLERNLEQLTELVDELKTPGRECYLITDGQELDWGELSDKSKESMADLTAMANVFVVPVEVDGENNISLTSLTYSSGSLQQSGVARYLADVRNEGRNPTDGGRVKFYVNDDLVTETLVGELEPGETRSVSFFTAFEKVGDVHLRAQLTTDELTADNDRYAVATVRDTIQVLCVDEVVNEGGGRNGAYYAVRAMRLQERETESAVQVNHVQTADLSLENLSDYDVILMADVSDVAPEMAERIEGFVRGGGGLIVFLGSRVDSKLYNQRLGKILPGKLGATLTADEDESGWSIAPVRSDHSLARIVKHLPQELTDTARFSKLIKVEPSETSQTVLMLTEQDAPLLLTRELDAGTVLLFTTSADRTWTELAVHPLYTMLLQQSLTNLTSRPDDKSITVGDTVELVVHGRRVGQHVQVSGPQGEIYELKVSEADQRPICSIETDAIGVYEIADDDESNFATVAANVDAVESNVRVLDADTLAGNVEPLGARVVPVNATMRVTIEQSRQGRELTGWLLAIGIAVFVLQSLLAKYFTNRMSQPETDVAASLQLSRLSAARRS
jgi:uncharacterized membrane protein